jgi:hypothetical protein
MRPLSSVLLADEELAVEPTHMTIVGHKDAPRAQSLHALARALPARYKRLQQPDLLVPLVQCRGASGHGEADGEAEAVARVVELRA